MINIDIVNKVTSAITDKDFPAVIKAMQHQISNHFNAQWGIDARLHFVGKGGTASADHWQIVVLDNSDQAGALGYHDVTKAGLPLGKVFAATDITNGNSWSITLSHELLEMLGDPDINLLALDENGTGWAYEMCDVVEADAYGYSIDGVDVSDFVFPSFFETFRTSGPFDQSTVLSAPFTIAPGGYTLEYTPGSGWTQQYGAKVAADYVARAPLGSRRYRRRMTRRHWLRSSV